MQHIHSWQQESAMQATHVTILTISTYLCNKQTNKLAKSNAKDKLAEQKGMLTSKKMKEKLNKNHLTFHVSRIFSCHDILSVTQCKQFKAAECVQTKEANFLALQVRQRNTTPL